MAPALNTERTEARLLPDQKQRIETAAHLLGISVSEFIVQHADEAATRTLEENQTWVLSDMNRDLFLEKVMNPPEPGERLTAAAGRFRKHF